MESEVTVLHEVVSAGKGTHFRSIRWALEELQLLGVSELFTERVVRAEL